MAEPQAKLENPSPNLVLGQSEDSPSTTRTLGLNLDRVCGLNLDSPRTVRGLSEFSPWTPSEDSPRVLAVLGLSSDCPWTKLGLGFSSLAGASAKKSPNLVRAES